MLTPILWIILACLFVHLVRSWPSAAERVAEREQRDAERLLRAGVRQWRREARQWQWQWIRAHWRDDLWYQGDGPWISLLLALAGVVIALCR
jgi:hypothetical protein